MVKVTEEREGCASFKVRAKNGADDVIDLACYDDSSRRSRERRKTVAADTTQQQRRETLQETPSLP